MLLLPPPCAQFGGFYFGGNLGYGYYDYRYHDRGNLVQTIDLDLTTSAQLNNGNWNGGVQAGDNWQSRCTVRSFEAGRTRPDAGPGDLFDWDGGTQDFFTLESRMKWFGTARCRPASW